jgi:hypothetical protein
MALQNESYHIQGGEHHHLVSPLPILAAVDHKTMRLPMAVQYNHKFQFSNAIQMNDLSGATPLKRHNFLKACIHIYLPSIISFTT